VIPSSLQYCEDSELILAAMISIRQSIGDLPLVKESASSSAGADESKESAPTAPVVLADGTYASQAAASSTETSGSQAQVRV